MAREPWLEKLEQGETEAAWDLLIGRYHRLISATVRHSAEGYDEVMDLFAHTCESLRANDLARVRKYAALPEGQVRFSTWLVAVVRNLVIDWFRHRDGRKRLGKLVRELPPAQREAFEKVYVDGLSPVEAYEVNRTHTDRSPSFGEFLRELTAAQRNLEAKRPGALLAELRTQGGRGRIETLRAQVELETVASSMAPDHQLLLDELQDRLQSALESLPAEDRIAVQLYVVEGLRAEEVARLVGWKSGKTVYNHVYRSLAAVRDRLKREGLGYDDL